METSHQSGQWKSKDHWHAHSQQMKINSVSRWWLSLVSCGAQRPRPVPCEKEGSRVPGIQDKPALVRGSLLDQKPEGQRPHCVGPSECRPCPHGPPLWSTPTGSLTHIRPFKFTHAHNLLSAFRGPPGSLRVSRNSHSHRLVLTALRPSHPLSACSVRSHPSKTLPPPPPPTVHRPLNLLST